MNADKSVSGGENSFLGKKATTMSITSRQKFDNVQKLTNIVKQIQQNNSKAAHPQQILQIIKTKIKTNYNNLYENYEQNKNLIAKNIQQIQTDDANEGTIKQKFQNVLKQKNAYDKLKAEVQIKQRKLKKMLDLKQQMVANSQSNQSLILTLQDRIQTVRLLDQHRNILQYETAVLIDMKKQRESVKLVLKQQQQNMLKEEGLKKQRTNKIRDAAHTKKILLGRIQQKIKQQDQCEIPLSLAEQLQRKLHQYQGKYTQQNILHHENRLNDAKMQYEKTMYEKQQQAIRKIKLAKEKADQREYDIANHHMLLKQTQQQKIKRLCRVNQISQIADGSLEEEKQKLQKIKQQIENQIKSISSQNDKLRKQIQVIMTTIKDQKNNQNINVMDLQKELDEQQTQLRRLKAYATKKQNKETEWETYLQLIFNGKCDKTNMLDKLQNCILKYEKFNLKEKTQLKTECETRQLRNLKSELNRKKVNSQTKGISNNYQSSQNASEQLDF